MYTTTSHYRHYQTNPLLTEKRLTYKLSEKLGGLAGKIGLGKKTEAVAAEAAEAPKNWRVGRWLISPKSVKGVIPRLLVAPFYAGLVLPWEGLKAGTRGVKNYVKTSSYYEPGKTMLKQTARLPVGAYHLTGGPVIESGKSMFVRLPMYALHDNIMTGFRTMWNIPATGISKAARFGWECIKFPVNVPWQGLKGLKRALWDAPKALMARDSRQALHHVISPATLPGKAFTQPFEAFGRGVGATIGEIGLAGFSYGANITRTALTPVESVTNGFRRQHKGLKILSGVGEIFKLGGVQSIRERARAIIKRPQPLAYNFAT
ncbi:hypothetical protein JW752_01870 [Candidatus Peregrinibacteria bacterium]|nr:hypothetical protein [Candidatus Peregrinibacteria bacterium]